MAHGILTIREGIGKEIAFDLKSIRVDNLEAKRFATQWLTDGFSEADKKRKPTRMINEGGSTPLRERSHMEISILIINLAIDMVKAELGREGSANAAASIAYLDEFIANMTVTSEKDDAYARFEDERKQPRTLLETLYYRSISDGAIISRGQASVNVLKLAQSIMDKRSAVACDILKIVNELAATSRVYYKSIKVSHGESYILCSPTNRC